MKISALGGDGRNAVDGLSTGLLPARAGVPNPWVRLDESWAKRLGVQRTSGTYRIRSRELVRRLAVYARPTGAQGERGTPVETIPVLRTGEMMMTPVPRRLAG